MFVIRFIYRFLGNLIWKLFGGAVYSAVWFLFALLFALTIVGFPIAVRCFRIGYLIWKPFGKSVAGNFLEYPILNLLWSLSFGLILSISAVLSALISTFTLIGIALIPEWFKVAKLSLMPFGAFIR